MPTLRDTIHHLASQFADRIVGAIRGASLVEIVGEGVSGTPKRGRGRPVGSGAKTKRLRRRSQEDITKLAEQIVSLVGKHKAGLNAEKIRAELGIAANEWARPITEALRTKKLTKKGAKRATTYFA